MFRGLRRILLMFDMYSGVCYADRQHEEDHTETLDNYIYEEELHKSTILAG